MKTHIYIPKPSVRGLLAQTARPHFYIGGIDSPVAGLTLPKEGKLEGVHFYSYPYTREKAKEKVIRLTKILSQYNLGMKLHIIPFTEIQLAINQYCPQEYLTIIMRRFMMKIAERIALENGSLGLITGEAIGQVASQTLESLLVTDNAVTLPVYRPCIGMDKSEVVEISRKIEAYETSILPYEDCVLFLWQNIRLQSQICKTIDYESV